MGHKLMLLGVNGIKYLRAALPMASKAAFKVLLLVLLAALEALKALLAAFKAAFKAARSRCHWTATRRTALIRRSTS